MRKTILQSILNSLKSKSIVEIPSTNLKADHKGFDKILRSVGQKDKVRIAEDRDRSTLIFHSKSE